MFCIELVPIGDLEDHYLKILCGELKKEIEINCKFGRKIPLPENAYDPIRRQYNGEALLLHLALNYKSECIVLGIVDEDLYAGNLNFIFGIAQIGGKACIIALPRLREEFYGKSENINLFIDRMTKEALHEVGHVLGLKHCENKECVMSFSNSIAEVDKKTRKFCKKHSEEIKRLVKLQKLS